MAGRMGAGKDEKINFNTKTKFFYIWFCQYLRGQHFGYILNSLGLGDDASISQECNTQEWRLTEVFAITWSPYTNFSIVLNVPFPDFAPFLSVFLSPTHPFYSYVCIYIYISRYIEL